MTKPVSEWSAEERWAWVNRDKQAASYRLKRPTVEGLVRLLLDSGQPLTYDELLGKIGSKRRSFTAWASRNREELEAAGVRKTRGTDARSVLWYVETDDDTAIFTNGEAEEPEPEPIVEPPMPPGNAPHRSPWDSLQHD